MQKKFLTNLGLLLLLNFLVKPLWILGIDLKVQNVVGAEEFGFYFSLLSFSFLFNMLLDLGLTTYNNRAIAQRPDSLKEHLGSIIGLRLLFAILYAVITLSIGFGIGYDSIQIKMLSLLCLNQFINGFIQYLRSNLSGLHLFKSDAFLSVLDRFLMICICGALLWGNILEQPFNIWWFIYSQTAAYSVSLIIALFMVLKESGRITISLDIAKWKELLKQSMPFALMVMLMYIYTRTDAVMLERLLSDGSYQAGVYAQGYRLLEAANMFAMLIAVLLLPIYSRMLIKHESVEKITRLAYGLIIAPAIILAITVYFNGSNILGMLYNESSEQAATVLSLLMLSLIPISTVYVFGTLLTANNNLRQINVVALMGIVINIGMNLILIPIMKAEGAALASVITQFTVAFVQVFLIQYIFRFKVNYPFLVSILLLIGLLVGLGYFSEAISGNWMLNLGIMVTSAIGAAFLLKLISIKSVIDILKEKSIIPIEGAKPNSPEHDHTK